MIVSHHMGLGIEPRLASQIVGSKVCRVSLCSVGCPQIHNCLFASASQGLELEMCAIMSGVFLLF